MRLSSLMFTGALFGAVLAGSAQAAVVTIDVSGTYAAGSNATLPATGPISGYLTFDATATSSGGGAPRFAFLSSDIKFGSGTNSVDFTPGHDITTNFEGQSDDFNLISLRDAKLNTIIFTFDKLSTDMSTIYTFEDTPVDFVIHPGPSDNAFMDAIGGAYGPTGPVIYPTANVTLTTAVPEPATWALMIGGFAVAGTALRRRPRPLAT